MFKRVMVPIGIDMTGVRFDFPGWVIARQPLPAEAYTLKPEKVNWDIHLVFNSDEEAVMWKLKYGHHQ
jgi:hypothetical protein